MQEETSEADQEENYLLHQAVFDGNIRKLSQLIREKRLDVKDKHGNYRKIKQISESFCLNKCYFRV